MTQEETVKRIEEDSHKTYPRLLFGTKEQREAFVYGAKSERNKVLDQAIEKVRGAYALDDIHEDYTEIMKILSSLKVDL